MPTGALEVKESKGRGRGVFAKQQIQQGAFVTIYPRHVWTDERGSPEKSAVMKFQEHSDFIASLLFVPEPAPSLVAASGDGCLSVFDLRKGRLAALSDCQEDELLSLALMKGGKKLLVGCQSGVVGLFLPPESDPPEVR